ncbi:MAG: hypothetical protein Hens3KO_16370 [Henriciella sp.]
MTRHTLTAKAIKSGVTTSLLVAAALSIAALASFQGEGLQIATGGVEVTLKASMDKGLEVLFASA